MATFTIPPPPPLDIDSSSLATSFKKFKQAFTNFELATGIATPDNSLRVATLLAVIGQPAVDLYNTFTWAGEADAKTYQKVIDQFEVHCKGHANTTYERYIFNTRVQREGESFESFFTSLKSLAETCEFDTLTESLIRDRIILGMKNANISQRLLREAHLTLTQNITIVRAAEAASAHASEIAKSTMTDISDVHYVKHERQNRQKPAKFQQQKNSKSQICRNCGDKYPHTDHPCPAQGKTCLFCKKQNHFAKVCKTKLKQQAEVNLVEQTTQHSQPSLQAAQGESNNEDYLFAIGPSDESNQLLKVSVIINDVKTTAVIDTGTSVNIMSRETLNTICTEQSPLEPTGKQVYAFGANSPIEVLGKISLLVRHKAQMLRDIFFITEHSGPTLLRLNTAKELHMIAVTCNVHAAPSVIDEFSDRFVGLGKLAGVTCKLHVDQSVTPVTQPHRRIPFHVRQHVEAELKRLQELDIIEPVRV
ncbi:hypothetical protein BSL78_11110 [Apostichopus japonicus]|uniref:Uncharacterized protein n=1 Tax=Stichopus japonicus TaxID=307972 RepID=A0A2G8KVE9_STIJA|nr:hypothetical protein BSL78_11110 [Apostichopus japonicus]